MADGERFKGEYGVSGGGKELGFRLIVIPVSTLLGRRSIFRKLLGSIGVGG